MHTFKLVVSSTAGAEAENGAVVYALARLGHPGFHKVAPPRVMGRLFVGLRGLFVAIDFVEDKPLRIIGLLQDVKTQVAGLQDCAGGVFARGRDECLNMLWLDLNEHRPQTSLILLRIVMISVTSPHNLPSARNHNRFRWKIFRNCHEDRQIHRTIPTSRGTIITMFIILLLTFFGGSLILTDSIAVCLGDFE